MIVESLSLSNFRNYRNLNIEFDPRTNIFYGDNAQGKTNILEAVYLSGTTKSQRGSRDKDMILFEEEEGHIRTKIKKRDDIYQIDIHLKKNKAKGIAVNGIPIRKASDLFGIANYISFSPEDLNIIKQGPSERRRFIDMELCQLDRMYYHYLWEYNRALMQRNQLLKDMVYSPELIDTLDIWDMQLAASGKKIIEERGRFAALLNEIVHDIHLKLTGNKEELSVEYEKNTSSDDMYERLKNARDRDLRMKTTTVGPHRDDLSFDIGGLDIRRYGSQGQQRTAALSLKLSEIEIVRKVTVEDPILLLDDVLSELDKNRQNYLLDSIGNIQTLVTCTGLDEFIKNRFSLNRLFYVSNGTVTQKIKADE